MISLVLLMLRARLRQAVAVCLPAAFTIAIAVATPAFLDAADRAMTANEMARATTFEQSLSSQATVNLADGRDRTFEQRVPLNLRAPWLTTTFAVDIDVYASHDTAGGRNVSALPELAFRENYCAHITLTVGRCPIASREIVVSAGVAERLEIQPGRTVVLQWAKNVLVTGWAAVGAPMTVSVVGIYRPTDPTSPYWGTEGYFALGLGERGADAPLLTERGTIEAIQHAGEERQHVDAALRSDLVTPELLPTIRTDVAAIKREAGPNEVVGSGIPALLDRIDRNRVVIREITPIVAVPLGALGCFVLFLTIAYAVQDRRTELGVVRLRGARLPTRWWLGIGESVLPILVGIPIGYLLGRLGAVLAVDATLSGDVPVRILEGDRRAVEFALLGLLIAVIAAYQRTIASSVVELLRKVPSRGATWRGLTIETVLVVLAAAAVVQLRVQPGKLTGVMLLAPALVIAAVAVIGGRFLPAIAARIGRAELGLRSDRSRRVRLGLGLGAIQLARRPGAQRLLVVQVLAVGLVTFVVASVVFGGQSRQQRVGVELGAARVLTIGSTTRLRLLDAVATADPTGRYAMAVAGVPSGAPSDPPILAVDASRLARVATWPADSPLSASQVAALLHPITPDPVDITATRLEMRVTASDFLDTLGIRLQAQLVPSDGTGWLTLDLGPLRAGDHTYTGSLSACGRGCRLASLGLTASDQNGFSATITVHELRTVAPIATILAVGLTDVNHWRAPEQNGGVSTPTLTAGPDGLTAHVENTGPGIGLRVVPRDTPYPLPVVSTTTPSRGMLGGMDGTSQQARVAGRVPVVPRLGRTGALVDLVYADRQSSTNLEAVAPEVWLSADAPAGIVDALHKAGLLVTGERGAADLDRYLDRQAPAVGMRFNVLAGIVALLLAIAGMGLMAAVDRHGRIEEMRVLRVQGLPISVAQRASLVGHVGLVLVATVLGGLSTIAAWLLTASRIPLFADGQEVVHRNTLPDWWTILVPAVVAGLLLAIVAVVAAGDLGRALRRASTAGGSTRPASASSPTEATGHGVR